MQRVITGLMGVLLLAGTPLGARAAEPDTGIYETQPGGGRLTIREADDGQRKFKLNAVGANGHLCYLEGQVEGDTGITEDGYGEECRIHFRMEGQRIGVESEADACHGYCGARAWFEDDYVRLPPACTDAARRKRTADFLEDYRARRYAPALARLQAMERECGVFFNWLEKDRFANDKAITLYHLGRTSECLAVLQDTLVGSHDDEESLAEDFRSGRTDWESYLPIARAVWTNRGLCEDAGE